MSWFSKRRESEFADQVPPKPTFYIESPVELYKDWERWTENDDSDTSVEKVSNSYITYTARTSVNDTEVAVSLSRYVGPNGPLESKAESEYIEYLREKLFHETERIKKLQADLPLGTWMTLDWSSPKIEVSPKVR